MNTVYLGREAASDRPCVATIGFFDGVHRGHQFLIKQVTDDARRHGLSSTVITFDRHPRQVLHSDFQPQLLTTLDEKLLLLSKTGIEQTVVLPFSEQMAQLSAYDFMQKVMVEKLNVKRLVIGYDNRFGHNREEGFDDYVRYGRETGIEVVRASAYVIDGVSVSSSVVRSFLEEGEVELAEQCLGYPYFLAGRVVSGYQEGRKLGFPTANISPNDDCKLIPKSGVYGVKVRLANEVSLHRGMMNVGTRPTYDGKERTLEVHIFQFAEDIYDQRLFVSFNHRVRPEHRYESIEALRRQLEKDKEIVEKLFQEREKEL